MPWKPKRPCSWPGCPKLTEGRYCEEHEKLANQRYERYGRSKEEKKRYGSRWTKIRNMYIAKHPLCELCLKEGRLTWAEEVHHIVPLGHGGSHAESNLMALCKACHSRITAEMGDRWHDRKLKNSVQKREGQGGLGSPGPVPAGTGVGPHA